MAQTPRFIQECLSRHLLLDGAMGTELQRAGLEPGESGERWNLEHPDRVCSIYHAYLAAGSDAILTNSFGANRWVQERYGLAGQVEAINRQAAVLARRAAGSGRYVLGDLGPFGGFLQPLGDVTPTELHAAFRTQVAALLAGGADGIVVETMSAIEEATTAVRAAREEGAPFVIASMTFDRLPTGALRTMMGVSPEQAGRMLVEAGADLVGANCGTRLGFDDFAELARTLREAAGTPVVVQPNAGQPELVDGRAVYRLSPEAYAQGMCAVARAGARVVGGCCGTTPAHIAALGAIMRTAAWPVAERSS